MMNWKEKNAWLDLIGIREKHTKETICYSKEMSQFFGWNATLVKEISVLS